MLRSLVIAIVVAGLGCGSGPRATGQTSTLSAVEEPLDEVVLADGQRVAGRVLFEGPDSVVVGQPNGTFTLKRSEVMSIHRGAGHRGMRRSLVHSERLPTFYSMLEVAARQPWVETLHQVPATVVGEGELRDIPYISHRAGDIEFNVYGDPEHPAGVEVGIYNADPDAQTRAKLRAFMAELLPAEADKLVVQNLNLEDDYTDREGLTFNVDPSTAADSFGGWWISIYDRAALERARATAVELAQLTAPAAPTTDNSSAPSGWSTSDYSYSSPRSSSGSSSGGGRVYVRGYTRKNGTYVHPHTRSTPRSRRR